ncbi:MAG: hypothetical protein Q8J68_14845 [Methanolobus sp.]|uniref:hypothetical protein n=1 Tax=Methanolobus sp. TaxID=1874737 RepID=UPI002730BFD8|nr:hypothetical protein [Methanolobus sp.]MDP2218553.1 hypothetical protein [Methanolobus sp.]
MPSNFLKCLREGGRVRTVKGKKFGCKEDEYRYLCVLNKAVFMGEIHKRKEKK